MNELAGWIGIQLGLLSGLLLGLGFLRPGFLGGYDAPERRLVRLAHIAFFGLGLLNILFARIQPELDLGAAWLGSASIGLLVGAIAMPLSCLLVAWRRAFRPLFAVPVICLVHATNMIIWGLLP